jgi:hypothetical protein
MPAASARFVIRHAPLTVALLAAPAGAQVLRDGNMDALTPGPLPNSDAYAGAWGFPNIYLQNNVAEPSGRPQIFTTVTTGSFQPGAPGNSLHLSGSVISSSENFHLPNVWTPVLTAAPGLIIRVTFNIWAVSGAAGGAFYVGGDNGGGGFSNATGDRTAQVVWTADGAVTYTDGSGTNTPIAAYAFDAWQNVRMDIDTNARTYDLYWSMGNTPPALIGAHLPFRAPAPSLSVNYDRLTYAQFGTTVPTVNSYLDNVAVTTLHGCDSADFDCDGDTATDADINAFLACLAGSCPPPPCANDADFNNDGDVATDADIEAFFRVLAGRPC